MSSSLDQLTAYLPSGWLPKWLLFLSIVSIGNSVQAYVSLAGTREVYAGSAPSSSPVTPLSARTFGTWTALSSIIRLYAAYHIQEPVVYQLALWTYGLAFAHFASEWLVFGTARWGRGLAGPIFVSTVTGSWMLAQWSSYVR
ncbi:ergosterol biosynthesis protein [Friedmanniomyces endolithicus]|uniref:Ergosterol biosynthesis protein n=1 Tax=Friedmanniomyces endolithicus TaxID=329885 RepID=A0A4U0U9X5_9PEZI|nr:ergosterol biosynthesis protein [Friedmanniomyces endolithicus]KAK0289171.1 ergosterol biosynthesis protein [Friedmanniomyces endolithicus]KAK0293938.1 ergosterol biosynthesis protein [Friedmanniomyces endolithicus]KAK0324455.1 ergosterol biosynthesis protein [Friedmanniomyces endolithicus]KAK0343644.1 ergosterol biosynthesis protein [Friedmanniomyces endolithicus]